MSRLAGSHSPDAAVLPRGRGRLPSEDVATDQRERILRAIVSAAAEIGYHAVTVGDIVTRARVSRAAFYRQFAGKPECFIAAMEMGRDIVLPRIVAARDLEPGGDLASVLRAMVREYLAICGSEPEFARAWALELAAAGPTSIQLRNRILDELALAVRAAAETQGTSRPFDYYVALIGGCHELVYRYVAADRIHRLGELEDPMVDFLVAALAAA
jgi:AcrR family transcriptional regulator